MLGLGRLLVVFHFEEFLSMILLHLLLLGTFCYPESVFTNARVLPDTPILYIVFIKSPSCVEDLIYFEKYG